MAVETRIATEPTVSTPLVRSIAEIATSLKGEALSSLNVGVSTPYRRSDGGRMRKYLVVGVACFMGSFVLAGSAQAATSAGTSHRSTERSLGSLEFPGKPKKERFCNSVYPGSEYELLVYTNKGTKVKTFHIPPFSDEGVIEKQPKAIEVLNEEEAFGFYYIGKKVAHTKRYAGYLVFGGEVTGTAEWGVGLTKELC